MISKTTSGNTSENSVSCRARSSVTPIPLVAPLFAYIMLSTMARGLDDAMVCVAASQGTVDAS